MSGGKFSRDKGLRGSRAVRKLLEANGWHVTATSHTRRRPVGTCDLIATRDGTTLAVEVKNHAVLRLPAWKRQTAENTPAGAVPVLAYKREHVWDVAYMVGDTWYPSLAVSFAQSFGRTAASA